MINRVAFILSLSREGPLYNNMASDDEDEVLYYTDEEWWLTPLRERDEDALGFICNLVEVKDSESELLDYFDDDYSGRLPEWLMKRIKALQLHKLYYHYHLEFSWHEYVLMFPMKSEVMP